jgi:hypothetical protein
MYSILRALTAARAKAFGLACMVVAMLALVIASVASAEPIIEPATKKATEEFTANLPPVLFLLGLLTAVALVIAFFRRHAKKA